MRDDTSVASFLRFRAARRAFAAASVSEGCAGAGAGADACNLGGSGGLNRFPIADAITLPICEG